MSRIITDNYLTKLNSILEELDYPSNLKAILDFFEEQIKIDQSRKVSKNQKIFSPRDFNNLQKIKNSVEIKKIFSYLNKIIKSFEGQYLHVHINSDLVESIYDTLIFLTTWNVLINSCSDENLLKNNIDFLDKETNRPVIMPSDCNKHRSNQIFREVIGKKYRHKFLQKFLNLTEGQTGKGCLININKGASACVTLSEFSEFPKLLNTYINYGQTLQSMYKNNAEILSQVDTIINLFPSETGSNIWYSDFIAENINEWNRLAEFNFKNVITITSGEKSAEKLLDMSRQNKFQVEEMYTIFPFEL
jgi:hypothetical protein